MPLILGVIVLLLLDRFDKLRRSARVPLVSKVKKLPMRQACETLANIGSVGQLLCNLSEYIVDFAQHHRLDEEQAFPRKKSKFFLYIHSGSGPTVLGAGDCRQLCEYRPCHDSVF